MLSVAGAAAAQPVPACTSPSIEQFLGEPGSTTVTLTNTAPSGNIGYQPIVEVVLPAAMTFTGASSPILGALTPLANVTVPISGIVTNPVTGEVLTGLTPGTTYLVLQPPIGSFPPEQPPVPFVINYNLSGAVQPDVVLSDPVTCVGIFSLGADPLANPGTDPVIRNTFPGIAVAPPPTFSGAAGQGSVTPRLYVASKASAILNDDVTGPNYPIEYTLGVDVANTATVNTLTLTETIPDNLRFVGVTGINVNAASGDPTVEILFTPFPCGSNSPVTLAGPAALSTITYPLVHPAGTAELTHPPADVPGGCLEMRFSAVTGEIGGPDAEVLFESYVPEFDANGTRLIPTDTGGTTTVVNTLTSSATSGTGGFGVVSLVGSDQTTDPVNVVMKSVDNDKGAAVTVDVGPPGLSPGDTIEWTLHVGTSDFFGHDEYAIQDVIGDGVDFDILQPGGAAIVVAVENGQGMPGTPIPFVLASVDPAPDITVGGYPFPYPGAPGATALVTQNARPGELSGTSPGFTTIVFDVSAYVGNQCSLSGNPCQSDGDCPFGETCVLDGNVDGGYVDLLSNATGFVAGIDDPTAFDITFLTTLQQQYENPASYTNDASIDSLDSVSNIADATAIVTSDPAGVEDVALEEVSAALTISAPSLVKDLVAINGVPVVPGPLEFEPGDDVTYSLVVSIPLGRLETLDIRDLLPLPVFLVDDPDADTVGEAWVFNSTVLPGGSYPTAGEAAFGPATSNLGAGQYVPTDNPPTITTDTASNQIFFTFPNDITFDPATPAMIDVEILFTIRVNGEPMADNLFLTNRAQASYANSLSDPAEDEDLIFFRLREPSLRITKGVLSAPQGTISPLPAILPVDGNVVGADAGDKVRYRITVENIGGAEAWDLIVTDPTVPGFEPGTCTLVSVTLGDGTVLNSPADYTGDAIATGLSLTGALAENDGTVGAPFAADTLLITIDCDIDADIAPDALVDNTASITSYTSIQGWPSNFVDPADPIVDTATVRMLPPEIAKSISSVSPAGAGPGFVTSGDTVTTMLTVTMPEGQTTGFTLTDSLPAGFAFQAGTVVIDTATPGFAGSVTGTPTVTVTGSVATGQTLELDFGTVTTTDDNNPATDTFRVSYQTVVDGSQAANDGLPTQQDKTNTVMVRYDGQTTTPIQASATIPFREPQLGITKSMSPATAQAFDTVTVTLVVTNTGTAPAHDVVVTDVLDPALFDLTPGSSVNPLLTPADFTYNYDGGSGTVSYTINSPLTIPAGGSRTFRFTAVVQANVVTASVYTNSADVDGDSQTGVVAGERDTQGNASANLTIASTSVVKSLTATFENHTDPGDASLGSTPPVAIGERMTYQIVFTMQQGVTRSVRLNDVLPTGVEHIAGTATLTRNTTALVAATNVGSGLGINGEPAGTAVPVTLSGLTGTIFSDLGNVTNSNTNSAVAETYTLRLDALVLNSAGNNAGNILGNRGRITYLNSAGTGQTVNSNTVDVRIAEPLPAITKVASPTTGSAGDTITFTVTVRNNASGASGTSGFDWTFTDTLPAEYINPTVTLIDNAGAPASTALGSFAGNTLSGTIDVLGAGQFVVITYTADIDVSARFGDTLPNSVTTRATSLPGTNGTAGENPNAAGSANGERTGTGGVNDLTALASASVTIDTPTILKTTLNPQSFWAIGDIATFRVTVALPAGTSNIFVVNDVLDAGLEFVPGSVVVSAPGVTGSNAPLAEGNAAFFTQTGQALEFDFGVATTPASVNVTIEYDARVRDVIGNQSGTLLDNLASLAYENPSSPGTPVTVGPVPTDIPVRVGEPNLTLGKSVTAGAVGSNAGDTISWSIVIRNDGNTTAYRTSFTDVLPDGPLGPPQNDGLYSIGNVGVVTAGGTALVNATQVALVVGDAVVSTTSNSNDTLTLPDFDLAPGASVTITFDSLVGNDAIVGQSYNNAIRSDYDSQQDGTGRDNASNPGGVDDDNNADLDNYEESTSQVVTLNDPIAIDKSVSPTTYTIGQDVVFTIRLSLVEGTTPSVLVTDSLPVGLAYRSSSIAVGNMGMVIGNPTYATPVVAGQSVTFNFGDVSNPPNLNATDDFISIEVTARVDNIPANQNGSVLENNTFVLYNAGSRADFDSDGGTPGIQGLDVVVVEPELVVTKTANPASQALGDVVTFTVTVQHGPGSTSNAYDIRIVDTLPAGLTYVPGSAMGVTVDGFVDPVLTVSRAALTLLDGSFVYTYQATVNVDAPVGVTQTNVANATWASLPGATGAANDGRTGAGGVNDYTTGDTADVVPDTDAFIDAEKSVSLLVDADGSMTVTPGDTLRYAVLLTNATEPVTGVVFTDIVPGTTTYVPASLSSSQGVTDASGAPSLSVDVGAMGIGSSVTITFDVTVNPGVPAGTVISNQGSVDSDQTVPEPTDEDGQDANGDQPTDVVVGGTPQPTAGLYVVKVVFLADDADSSGSVTPGDRLTYALVFDNQGSQTLTNVTLADVIPTGLTGVPGSEFSSDPGATVLLTASTLDVSGMTIAAGTTDFVAFDVTIDGPPLYDGGLDGDPAREDFVNQGVADSDQTPPVLTDSDGDPGDGYQPTSIAAVDGVAAAPRMDLQKRVTLALDNDGDGLVDPLDVLEYQLTLVNSGSTDAANVFVSDSPMPNNTTYVPGSVTTSQGSVVSENPVLVNVGTLAPGGFVIVRFRTTVNAGTPNGTIIVNQALATGDNFAGEDSDDNGDDGDGENPNLTPVDTGVPGGGGPGQPAFDKSIVTTSEAGSAGSTVLIGEVVTYQLQVDVPAGATNEVTLSDLLPAGSTYLPGSAQLSRTFDVGLHAQRDRGGINAAASGVFVPLADGVDISAAGQVITLHLGTVINSDSDAGAESYRLRYGVVVGNVIGNQGGTTLTNAGQLEFWDNLSQVQTRSDAETVTVAVPNLVIAKAIDAVSVVQAGETLTFTLTATNPAGANTATAYDVRVFDQVPSSLQNVTIVSATPGGGVSGVVDNTSGNLVDLTAAVFPAGGQLLVTFTADVGLSFPLGGILVNNADVHGTSLPGTNGTANANPNAPGSPTGERTFTGGVNDLAASASASTIPPASLGDRVWLDEDGDGVQDAGEDGIAGVTVRLYDATGTVLLGETTTDADGGYVFPYLTPGDYVVRIDLTTLPAGLAAHPTFDEDGGLDSESAASVASGEFHRTADFGFNWVAPADSVNPAPGATGALGDRIWNDADGNGVQDPGESGIAGVTVRLLTDDNGDGIYGGAGDAPAVLTTTDAAGNYIFDGLAPGAYVVSVDTTTLPAGFVTTPTGDPDGDGNNISRPIVIAPGDVYLLADFGYTNPGGHALGDRIWLDLDADGVQDPGEPGIAGVTVSLLDGSGNVIATDVTDASGNYLFPGLVDGTYTVVNTDTAGALLATPTNTFDPDGGSDRRSTVVLAGADNLDQDFGFVPPGHTPGDGLIGDTVFLDRDADSVFDAGEGIQGVTVELYDSTGTTLLATTVTNANGQYYFGGLDPTETYVVRVLAATLPGGGAGLTNTVDPDGPGDGESTVDLSASAGGIDLDQDFGYVADIPNTISGTLWNDLNADGLLGAGEAGRFQGVTVVLLDANGNIVATTTTDAAGGYLFEGLPDGTYTIDVTDSANVLGGLSKSTGPVPGTDNNSQTETYTVSVAGGSTDSTGDFGYYAGGAAVGNFVWNDYDNDGIQDVAEAGVAGIVVTLTVTYPNGDVTTIVTVTDALGAYSFGSLLLDEQFNGIGAGEPTYVLAITIPGGTTASPIGAGGNPLLDSGNPAGTAVTVTQGVTNTTNDTLPNNGYDFGLVPQSDVSVAKAVVGTIVAGSSAVFTITVTNNGPGDALGVIANDPTPSGLTFLSNSGDCVSAYPCALGTLTAGETRVITSTYDVSPTSPPNPVLNTATVSTTSPDTNPANNTASTSTPLSPGPDLTVVKSDSGAGVNRSEDFAYTIVVTNNGPAIATNVVAVDTLDPYTSYVADTGNCVEAPPSLLTCALGTLAPGASATFTVTVHVAANAPFRGGRENSFCNGGQDLCNRVSVSARQPDPVPGNNRDDEPTNVRGTMAVADLAITKTDLTGPVLAGAFSTYSISVTNLGPEDADLVRVSDTLDPDMTYVTSSLPCTQDPTGQLGCSLGTLASGATITFEIVVHISGSAPTASTLTGPACPGSEDVCNRASVSSVARDPDPSNNTALVATDVLPPTGAISDLSLVKSDLAAEPVQPGSNVTYRVVVSNAGPSDAADVVVFDTLDRYMTYVSDNFGCSVGAPSGSTGSQLTCPLGTVAAGTSATLDVVVSIAADAPTGSTTQDGDCASLEDICNTATVTTSSSDFNVLDNQDAEPTDVSASATCNDGVVDPGEECDPPDAEVCNNGLDDNGDGLVDCADPACLAPGFQSCSGDCLLTPICVQILDDPARISAVRLTVHGRFIATTSADPFAEGARFVLSNSNGEIYSAELYPGDMSVRTRKSLSKWVFKDKAAKSGAGSRGGIYRLGIHERPEVNGEKSYVFTILAFGDMSAAEVPTMTTQIYIGDDVGYLTADWLGGPGAWYLTRGQAYP